MQDFGEVISNKTRVMGLERKASACEKQPPRSGLVQPFIELFPLNILFGMLYGQMLPKSCLIANTLKLWNSVTGVN